MSATESELGVGDIIQRKFPGTIVRWKVVAVEEKRVRFRVDTGYRFWIDRETADRYWLPDRIAARAEKGLPKNSEAPGPTEAVPGA
jgi:hypothetical protein